jgi:hypothetical protein
MAENFDPVLGGQQPAGSDPVMGGLVGIEQALGSPNPKVRIQAIKGALRYGSRGAELVIQALRNDPNWEVQFAAWETLLESKDPQQVQVAKSHRLPLRQVGDVRARYEAGERDFRWANLRGTDLSRGRPELGLPERGQPEQGLPERGQPEQDRPKQSRPELGQPERGQPEQGQPEQDRPKKSRPEPGQPERGQPERSQPEWG